MTFVQQKRKKWKIILLLAAIFILIALIMYISNDTPRICSLLELRNLLKKKAVKLINSYSNYLEIYLKDNTDPLYMHASPGIEWLSSISTMYEVDIYTLHSSSNSYILSFIYQILSLALVLIIANIFMRAIITRISGARGTSSEIMDVLSGEGYIEYSADKNDITLDDVKGLISKRKSIEECIDFLKSPEKFFENGARLPKGLLLSGPPGTGKTLIARAFAGETKLPLLVTSGSQFDEVFVGLGSKRIRTMFSRAKSLAKEKGGCVIFIDEIDAVASKRKTEYKRGDTQTINQLLVEMDGFRVNERVLVIGATNQVDTLDEAILRSGRFDRKIEITSPNMEERKDILNYYLNNVPADSSVNTNKICQLTTSWSGADLENLVNESAIASVSERKPSVSHSDIMNAYHKLIMGEAGSTKIYTEEEKYNVAVHEAGHALVCFIYQKQLKTNIQTLTLVPRGDALGFLLHTDEREMVWRPLPNIIAQIKVALGGFIAEKQILGDEKVSMGARSDFEKVHSLIRQLINSNLIDNYLKPVSFQKKTNFHGQSEEVFSDRQIFEMEKTANDFLSKIFQEVKTLIIQNKTRIERIANILVKRETIGAEEITEIMEAPVKMESIAGQVERPHEISEEDTYQPVQNIGYYNQFPEIETSGSFLFSN